MNSTKAATNVAWLGLACLGLLACSPEDAEQGALGPAGRSANDRVAAQFPEQVLVLQCRGEGLKESADGRFFSTPRLDPSLSLYLDVPMDRKEPVVVSRASGFALRVWDNDQRGEAVLVDGQVSYGRAKGGTSFWVTAKNRAEEWLYYPEGLHGVEAASYRLEGGEPRQHGTTIDVYDAAGKAQLTMSAPQVFAATGDHVDARMVLEGDVARVILEHAVEGPLLVDPVFVPAGDLNVDRRSHRAVLLNSGKVLIAGGFGQTGAQVTHFASDELFDPATATFTLTPAPPAPREFHTATLLQDGRVLVVGFGCDLYDEVLNAWLFCPDMITPRGAHAATLMPDGKVLASAGGEYTAELYDPATNTWKSAGTMADDRGGHTSMLLPSGDVIITGGIATDGPMSERYDVATNSWQTAGTANSGHVYVDPLYFPNGVPVLTSGEGVPALGADGTIVESYNAATASWTKLPNTAEGRTVCASTSLKDGSLMVTGGDGVPSDGALLSSTEVLLPGANAWTPGPPLSAGRVAHTATLLQDGRVLIAGGFDIGTSMSSAELLSIDSPLGTPCAHPSECASVHCVDGVCCDSLCDGTCETCVAVQGAVADGTCSPSTGDACDDQVNCTIEDTCQSGLCVGQDKECPPNPDPCWIAGCYEQFGGQCLSNWAPDGTTCDDGLCHQGQCISQGAGGAGGQTSVSTGTTSSTAGTGGGGGISASTSSTTGGSGGNEQGGAGGQSPNPPASASGGCAVAAAGSPEEDDALPWMAVAILGAWALAARATKAAET